MVTKLPFGMGVDGEAASLYKIENADGTYAAITDYGATITEIVVPDKNGKLGDVNLSFETALPYASGACGSMGMIIGRVGNRIKDAEFELEGKTYYLPKNDNGNCLHGGVGFGMRMWQVDPIRKGGADALRLRYLSEDGDQGFPGKLDVTVTYTWNDQNELRIHYQARTDKPTVVNLTNHAYFNLEGHDAGSVRDHVLQINADLYTEVGMGLIPTGRLLPLKGTAMDFSTPRRIGDVLSSIANERALTLGAGVDINYCAGRDRETKTIATLYAPKSGRVMDVITDQPGVQCYTGNHLDYPNGCKGGAVYTAFSGMCLETQHYQDAIHHPHFPSIVLRPQDTYDTFTVYRFGVR